VAAAVGGDARPPVGNHFRIERGLAHRDEQRVAGEELAHAGGGGALARDEFKRGDGERIGGGERRGDFARDSERVLAEYQHGRARAERST
jgi:hypothetical protein